MMPAHTGGVVVAPFSGNALLHGWEFPVVIWGGAIVVGVVYVMGYQRVRSAHPGAFGRYRLCCFLAGLVAVILALDGPMDTYADVNLAVHMLQHVVLLYIVAPLIVLGAPLTLIRLASPESVRRKYIQPILDSRLVRTLSNPWIVAALCAADLLASHFTRWYNLSLENQNIHDLEHLSYLVAGFLLAEALLGVDPALKLHAPGQRILALFALMPVMVLIAVVFIVAAHPLYPYYPALPPPWGGEAVAMDSQAVAGAIMWVPSMVFSLATLACISLQWFRAGESRTPARPASNEAVPPPSDQRTATVESASPGRL